MEKKYQIFISSTYDDLKEERDQVIKAVLEMNHIPVGMEMFSADNEEQWEVIKRTIERSDYYVVIVAHRYGSEVNGRSYTEMEYDHAVECGVPVLGFVLDESAKWSAERFEVEARGKIARFRAKVKSRTVDFWESTQNLYAKASIALGKAFQQNPREGWIRASSIESANGLNSFAGSTKKILCTGQGSDIHLSDRLDDFSDLEIVSYSFGNVEINLCDSKVIFDADLLADSEELGPISARFEAEGLMFNGYAYLTYRGSDEPNAIEWHGLLCLQIPDIGDITGYWLTADARPKGKGRFAFGDVQLNRIRT